MSIELTRLSSNLVKISLFNNELYFSFDNLIAVYLSNGLRFRIDTCTGIITYRHLQKINAVYWNPATEEDIEKALRVCIGSNILSATIPTKPTPRSLLVITEEIKKDWKNIPQHVRPYIEILATLNNPNDHYGYDLGKDLIKHFLTAARTWRGETARRVKQELKTMLKQF